MSTSATATAATKVKKTKSKTPTESAEAPKVSMAAPEPVKEVVQESVLTTMTELTTTEEPAASLDENSIEVLFNKLVNQFQDIQLVMKTLQSNLKVLQKEVLKDRKESKKRSDKKKKSTKPRSPSGFAKPSPISDELAGFLDVPAGTQLARTEVTSKIIAYVKENTLQNEANKKEIIPNDKLRKLLQPSDGDVITFFNLQTYLKKHFLAATTTESVTVV